MTPPGAQPADWLARLMMAGLALKNFTHWHSVDHTDHAFAFEIADDAFTFDNALAFDNADNAFAFDSVLA